MAALPRILTVDPKGSIAQQVRAALDLMDRLIVQIDAPSAGEALNELRRAPCQAIFSAWEPGDGMPGWQLAAEVRKISEDLPIVILADYDDTELDEETIKASPFVYLKRPYDVPTLLRVLNAALDGQNIFEAAYEKPVIQGQAAPTVRFSAVPTINADRAVSHVDTLRNDLNAMAILLATREGEVLLERGTIGYIDRAELTRTLLPPIISNIEIKKMVGGNTTLVQFYDGDEYDVFVLSVGMHHFIIIIFDGTSGSRQFGAVNRFGRRCAEDLIALLGADAWIIQRLSAEDAPKKPAEMPTRAAVRSSAKTTTDEFVPVLEHAQINGVEEPEQEPERMILEAIPDESFDADALFAMDNLEGMDDLFSLENLEQIAREETRAGTISDEEARRLGLIK